MLRKGSLLVLLVATLALSCLAPQPAEMAATDAHCWESGAQVELFNADTLSLRRLSIAIRTNSQFKATALPLTIAVTAPDGTAFQEQYSLPTADIESSTIVAKSIAIPYRDRVCLSQSGNYRFIITPQIAIKGVEAVGIVVSE